MCISESSVRFGFYRKLGIKKSATNEECECVLLKQGGRVRRGIVRTGGKHGQ